MPSSFSPPATAARPLEVTPHLPDPHLPGTNWADAFEIETPGEFGDMKSLAEQTIRSMPDWARGLLRVRNALLTPFAIKSVGLNDAQSAADCVDIFPVLEESKDQTLLGLNDKHLDFRIVVERSYTKQGYRLRATTLVGRYNVLGRICIAIIKPFHRLIVRSVLKNAF